MFALSDAAGAQLYKSLSGTRMEDHEGKCFRVVPQEGNNLFTLHLARPAPSDSTFEHEGEVVLALPEEISPLLNDKSLDIDQSGNLKLI